MTDEQIAELRQIGFTDEQIAETALNVAMFLALTVMADVYGLKDSGFHLNEVDPAIPQENDQIIMGDLRAWEEAGGGSQ